MIWRNDGPMRAPWRRPEKRGPKFLPAAKRWKVDAAVDAVRAILSTERPERVTLEELAERLRAKHGVIAQALHRLNLAGVVSQRINVAEHESGRNPRLFHGPGLVSSWQASFYRVLAGDR